MEIYVLNYFQVSVTTTHQTPKVAKNDNVPKNGNNNRKRPPGPHDPKPVRPKVQVITVVETDKLKAGDPVHIKQFNV